MPTTPDDAFDTSAVGRWITEPAVRVDADRIAAYARATGEDDERFLSGEIAPIVFGVVPSWSLAGTAIGGVATPSVFDRAVHGEHSIVAARALVPGDLLTSRAAAISVGAVRSGTVVVARIETRDESGRLVIVQHSSSFFLGVTTTAAAGTAVPVAATATMTENATASADLFVPENRPALYADASGDRSAIHLDVDAARRLGLPGIILHGMCSLAMAGRGVAGLVADGDGTALREIACRFSKPVLPGTTLTVSTRETGPGGVEFRVTDSNDSTVLSHAYARVGLATEEIDTAHIEKEGEG